MDERLLVEGPLGRMRADDVLQLVAHLPEGARVVFETEDRASGALWRVELELEAGRLVAVWAGAGLRVGDLAVGRGFADRAAVEALAAEPGPRLGERMLAAGMLEIEELEDLLWERHARVVWSLLAWDRGHFRAETRDSASAFATPLAPDRPPPGPLVVEPPIALEAILLDGLQRAESALAR